MVTQNNRTLKDDPFLSRKVFMNNTNQESINLSMLVWNVQGVARKEFLFTLRGLIWRYNPSVLVLVKTKISGTKANEVCKKIAYII